MDAMVKNFHARQIVEEGDLAEHVAGAEHPEARQQPLRQLERREVVAFDRQPRERSAEAKAAPVAGKTNGGAPAKKPGRPWSKPTRS